MIYVTRTTYDLRKIVCKRVEISLKHKWGREPHVHLFAGMSRVKTRPKVVLAFREQNPWSWPNIKIQNIRNPTRAKNPDPTQP